MRKRKISPSSEKQTVVFANYKFEVPANNDQKEIKKITEEEIIESSTGINEIRYCMNCGSAIRKGVAFCGECGTKVGSFADHISFPEQDDVPYSRYHITDEDGQDEKQSDSLLQRGDDFSDPNDQDYISSYSSLEKKCSNSTAANN